jgi:hypothetical protein
MSLTESLLPQSIKPAQYQGPLDWRKLVQWLQEDAVITAQEAERTVRAARPPRARSCRWCAWPMWALSAPRRVSRWIWKP